MSCNNPVFGGGFCNWHQGYRVDKKKPAKINLVSDKEKVRLAKYRKVRDKFMKENPKCQCNCGKDSTDLHHKMENRRGEALADVNQFMAVCRSCHSAIHSDHSWAVDSGYLGSLEQKESYERFLEKY